MSAEPVEGWPGWTRHRETLESGRTRTYYRNARGETVSAAAFKRHPDQGAMTAPEISPSPSQPETDVWQAASLPDPEPKPLPSSGRDQRVTSEELSFQFLQVVILVTGIIAFLLRTEELRVSPEEARDIAVPAANIFTSSSLNKKYGYLARSSGDYTQLGYGLGSYLLRVAEMVRARKEQGGPYAASQHDQPAQSAAGVAAPSDSRLNGHRGAFAPQAAPTGWYSPIPTERTTASGATSGVSTGNPPAPTQQYG